MRRDKHLSIKWGRLESGKGGSTSQGRTVTSGGVDQTNIQRTTETRPLPLREECYKYGKKENQNEPSGGGPALGVTIKIHGFRHK